MGSLPNLNELCREKAQRRVLEKERDLVRERARQLEFTRPNGAAGSSDTNKDTKEYIRERLPSFFQVSFSYLIVMCILYSCTVTSIKHFTFCSCHDREKGLIRIFILCFVACLV